MGPCGVIIGRTFPQVDYRNHGRSQQGKCPVAGAMPSRHTFCANGAGDPTHPHFLHTIRANVRKLRTLVAGASTGSPRLAISNHESLMTVRHRKRQGCSFTVGMFVARRPCGARKQRCRYTRCVSRRRDGFDFVLGAGRLHWSPLQETKLTCRDMMHAGTVPRDARARRPRVARRQ